MTLKRVTLVVAIAAAMLDTPRSVRGASAADLSRRSAADSAGAKTDLSRRSAADSASAKGDWLQWGGAGRNFMPDATGLAASWPAGGPKKLWSRALGEGHSSILVEGGHIYTMYRPLGLLSAVRRSQEEVVAAIDAASG